MWNDQVRSPWTGTGAVIRFGWLPAKLAEITTLMNDVQAIAGPWCWRAESEPEPD